MGDKSAGFTLVELITVITIIGVLAIVVGPRFASTDVYEARTFYDDVVQALRFARAKAAASGCYTQVDFTAQGFTVTIDSDCNSSNGFSSTDVFNPADFVIGYQQLEPAPAGISYTASIDPVLFDAQGRALDSTLALLSANASIIVGAQTISIEAGTGYVH